MLKNKKLELGLFSYSYHLAFGAHDVFTPKETKKMDIFSFMDRVKELGFDGIQIDPMHLESYKEDYLNKVLNYAKNKGFYLEYGTTGVEENHLFTQLEIAKKLESPILRTYIGFDPMGENVDPKKEVENAILVLNKVKEKAAEYNIKIAIENHCDLTTDELVELVKEINSPYVGVCVDLGNFMIHLEDPVVSVKKLAPYIFSTHFKDYAFSMENWGFKSFGVALGKGVIDLEAVLNILIEDSKLDKIMLELPVEKCLTEEATLKKEDDIVVESVKYAREVLGIK
ncbi:sugar phosphate isomerase/epimerase family protein [Clostridium grantii]|uniref:Sugar phosphate isomerase/epimerase n=1 Tax=Clostridium grantii DSM 8605 TaxID=1121316 RepID=A0A1M5UBP2_9CLOT|nr:sugar phosphate isomerase/epimerase family protein [Clostridium grantii]SHH60360.1 Sugar phosphate isomerase/epimerase [Clostridium grantii DSM 8605]